MPERGDVSVRRIAIGAAIVAAGIGASLGVSWLLAAKVAAPATGPSRGEPPRIEGAALQTAPPRDLAAFLREKNERLSGTGPVDDRHVHIPIERAMQILSKGRER